MNTANKHNCPDCLTDGNRSGVTRREFVRRVGGAAVVVGAGPLLAAVAPVHGAPTATSTAETAVGRFHASLTDAQKKVVCLPFNHELRNRINANWHITEPLVGDDFYTASQRELIDQIVRGVTSDDGYQRLQKQMDDDSGGIDAYSVALFGDPAEGGFEWELTGRHLTLRADGNSVANAAFGGPIVYGHGEEDPGENLFHYQTKQANEVFRALDAPQAKQALLSNAPQESAVAIQGRGASYPGIRVGDLSGDQKELVERTLRVLMAPYRQEDVDEAMQVLKAGGGLDELHMAFYNAPDADLNDDKIWDVWRVEGPSFVWHFRGAPHVHAYINIAQRV
jgi:hypothetical protein